MTVEELDQGLRDVQLKLLEIEEAARGVAAEARTQAAELLLIRGQAQRYLAEKPKT